MSKFSIPKRISWAAKRKTTVEEDQVYCLLGIFGIYMSVIYGEGLDHAIKRLRKEISACKYLCSLLNRRLVSNYSPLSQIASMI